MISINILEYFRTVLKEHLNFNVTADGLGGAGGLALRSVMSKVYSETLSTQALPNRFKQVSYLFWNMDKKCGVLWNS